MLPAPPVSITLYGVPYAITLSPTLMEVGQRYGDVDFNGYEITIDALLPLEVQWATLCHEVVHIIDFTLKLALTEDTIHRLDTGLGEFVLQLVRKEL